MTLTQPPITQDAVLRLDAARFRRELYIRGITAGTVARVAGVAPNTVSRILAGAPISIGTLRAIAKALDSLPVLHGVDELLAVETTRNAAVPATAAFEEESCVLSDPRHT
jgi:transcriptional regulator with XRE-family HTH domain